MKTLQLTHKYTYVHIHDNSMPSLDSDGYEQ